MQPIWLPSWLRSLPSIMASFDSVSEWPMEKICSSKSHRRSADRWLSFQSFVPFFLPLASLVSFITMDESTDPSASSTTSSPATPTTSDTIATTSITNPTSTADRRSSLPSSSRSSLSSSSSLPPPSSSSSSVSHRDGSPLLPSAAPSGPTAFRSFWQAPAGGGAGDGDPYGFSLQGAMATGAGPNYKITKRTSLTGPASSAATAAATEAAAAPSTAAAAESVSPSAAVLIEASPSPDPSSSAAGASSGAAPVASYGSTSPSGLSADSAAIDVAAASGSMASESAPLLGGGAGGGGGGGGSGGEEEEERRKGGCSGWLWAALAAALLSLLTYYFFHPGAVVAGGIGAGGTAAGGAGGGGALVPGDGVAAICNPFSIRPDPTIDLIHNHGILAHLHPLPNADSEQARLAARHVSDYISPSSSSSSSSASHPNSSSSAFLFSSLNVPTRSFTSRFVDAHSRTVVEAQYFGLQFETIVQLSKENGDALGDYQFAVLSDDGAVVRVGEGKEGGRTKQEEEEEAKAAVEGNAARAGRVLIDNDGVHSTRLAVSPFLLPFPSYSHSYPLHLSYFQGPPSHIALVLLWRNVSAANAAEVAEGRRRGEEVERRAPREEREGVEGNEAWWEVGESEKGEESRATELYGELVREGGWRVLRAENYYLPRWFDWHAAFGVKAGIKFNPCV